MGDPRRSQLYFCAREPIKRRDYLSPKASTRELGNQRCTGTCYDGAMEFLLLSWNVSVGSFRVRMHWYLPSTTTVALNFLWLLNESTWWWLSMEYAGGAYWLSADCSWKWNN